MATAAAVRDVKDFIFEWEGKDKNGKVVRGELRSGGEAQVSAQHAVAVSLLLGRAGLDEFSDACLADPPGKDVAAKLVFVDDDRYPVESATVTLHLRGGRRLSRHVAAARGSLAAPLDDASLEDKLRRLAAWGGSGCAPQPLIDAIASFSFLTHFSSISKGVIDLRDLVYFGALIAAWLAATVIVLDLKKAD